MKRWIYDSGIHIPLILYIPHRLEKSWPYKAGSNSKQLISSVDLAATVLALTHTRQPKYFEGSNILDPVRQRDKIFAVRDRMDERYETIRAVRTLKFKYIRNFTCDKPYYQYMNSAETSPVMQEIRRMQKSGQLPDHAARFTTPSKPKEELYDITKDPYEVNNLANDPFYQDKLNKLREALFSWMWQTRDLGLIPEPELLRLARLFGSRYAVAKNFTKEYYLKLLETASSAGQPEPEDLSLFTRAVAANDISIGYWGLIGLSNYPDKEKIDIQQISSCLQDSSATIRLAAADVLCKVKKYDSVIALLKKEVMSPREWIRLRAVTLIDEHPSMVHNFVNELESALSDKENKYVVRVANHALNVFRNTHNKVR
jgi:uncharacterized sulfatase